MAVGLPLATSPLLTPSQHSDAEGEEEVPPAVEEDDDNDGLRRVPVPPSIIHDPLAVGDQGKAAIDDGEEKDGRLVSFPSIAPEGDPDAFSVRSTTAGGGDGGGGSVLVTDLVIPSPTRSLSHRSSSASKHLLIDRIDSPHPLDEEGAARLREEAKARRLEVRKRRVRRR